MVLMDVFVARQAILNRQKDLFGYELLFRSSAERNCYDGTDSCSSTQQVIANTLFSAGLEGILGGKKGFINFDRKMLLDGSWSILPKENVVIEVLESVGPDEAVVEACGRLRASGYMLALDDFVDHPKFEPLTHMAQIIKVDVLATSRAEQKHLVVRYGKRGIRMLAEKVETLKEFDWALSVGFDYFQGYFFTKPVVVRGRQIPSSKISCLNLLQETQREPINFEKVRDLIKNDVAFSYKLLRFTNSAFFAHQTEIRAIDRALMVLGEEGIRRWVTIAAMIGLAKDKPSELIAQSLLRARFAEQLARIAGHQDASNWFLMGLFSHLDALLDRTMENALQQIELNRPVKEVLSHTAPADNRMACGYSLICSYEKGDWASVTKFAQCVGVQVSEIGQAYVESARWASEVTAQGC
jgi:EAL and modified HD-GYP domain-containing signal transduction protein